MQEHIFLENYGNDDVFSFQSTIFKVGRLREVMRASVVDQLESALNESFKTQGLQINTSRNKSDVERIFFKEEKWFGHGIDCEALKIGAKGWKKGRVKIRVIVEFCPYEPEVEETPQNNQLEISPPESPLDDLRR